MGYVDLLVPKRATFKLIQGEGPISLVGSHCVDFYGYRDVGAGDDEDDEEEEDAEKDGETKKSSPAKGEKKTPSKEKEEKTSPNKEGGSGGKKRKASEEK